MKNNIDIFTDDLRGHGGEETVLNLFLKYFNDLYNINVIIPMYKGNDNWLRNLREHANKVKFNSKASKSNRYSLIVSNLIKSKAKVIICMTPQLTYLAYTIRKIFKKNYLILSWRHFSLFKSTNNKSMENLKKWYTSADYYFAISSGIRDELIDLGVDPKRIYTIYNPVIHSNKIISNKNDNVTHFLCIARIQFQQQKNLKDLFEGLSHLSGEWVLDIYGNDDTDGKEEIKKCKDYTEILGISDRIIWHGWVENVWDEHLNSNCLVMTSNFEGFPMALCEAASHGLPLISSNCPTGPSDIINEKNGYLYKMHDIPQLTRILQKFIDKRVSFNQEEIVHSISEFYVDNYIKNVKCSIEKIIDAGINY